MNVAVALSNMTVPPFPLARPEADIIRFVMEPVDASWTVPAWPRESERISSTCKLNGDDIVMLPVEPVPRFVLYTEAIVLVLPMVKRNEGVEPAVAPFNRIEALLANDTVGFASAPPDCWKVKEPGAPVPKNHGLLMGSLESRLAVDNMAPSEKLAVPLSSKMLPPFALFTPEAIKFPVDIPAPAVIEIFPALPVLLLEVVMLAVVTEVPALSTIEPPEPFAAGVVENVPFKLIAPVVEILAPPGSVYA